MNDRRIDLKDTVPDPAFDFEGCIEAIADKVVRELKATVPDDLPEVEKRRRWLARAGEHYMRLVCSPLPIPVVQEHLLAQATEVLERRAREYLRMLDEGEAVK